MKLFFKLSIYLLLLVPSLLKAQLINNLVVFCNDAEKFTVILDGLKENADPQTNVKMMGLDLKVYKIKVIFQNTHLKDVNTTITFNDNGYECIFSLDKVGHKKYKLNYVSAKPIENVSTHTNSNSNTNSNTNNNVAIDTVKTVVPAIPPPSSPMDPNNNMNQTLNIGGTKGNIKVNENGQVILHEGNVNLTLKKHPKKNCPNPVSKAEFDAFKENMSKQLSEEDKETIGNAFVENNCLLSSQVKEALALFKSDKVRLDFAKKAYSCTKDYEKFSITIDGIVSPNEKEELRKYIEEHK